MLAPYTDIQCSLARSLTVLGDRWTPLVIRDLWLGIDQFDQLVLDLGLSRAVLTERLDRLVEAGVVRREPYQDRPERSRYLLTAAGAELVPILLALTQWGDRWRSPEPPVRLTHAECGAGLSITPCCAHCGAALETDAVRVHAGPGGRAARGTRVVAAKLAAAGAKGLSPAPSSATATTLADPTTPAPRQPEGTSR